MDLLRLSVLGTPEVFHNGSRLTFPLRKAQALLLYLGVEGGMHSRSKLAALLWPDSEPSDALKGLRNALALLRHLLAGPDASASPHSHLLSEHELLGLDPHAPLELDLDVVQQAWHQAQRLSSAPSQEQRAALVSQVQHALSLVRGPFLESLWPRSSDGPRLSPSSLAATSRRGKGNHRPCCWQAKRASAKRGWPVSLWPGRGRRVPRCSVGKPSRWGDDCPINR